MSLASFAFRTLQSGSPASFPLITFLPLVLLTGALSWSLSCLVLYYFFKWEPNFMQSIFKALYLWSGTSNFLLDPHYDFRFMKLFYFPSNFFFIYVSLSESLLCQCLLTFPLWLWPISSPPNKSHTYIPPEVCKHTSQTSREHPSVSFVCYHRL